MGETMGKLLKETEEKLTKEDAGMSEYGEIQTMFLRFLIPSDFPGIRRTACGDTNFIQKILEQFSNTP